MPSYAETGVGLGTIWVVTIPQTTSLRAFQAVQQYALGKRGRPRFKDKNNVHSIEGKEDAVIRFRTEPEPAVHWNGLVLRLRLDPKDNAAGRGKRWHAGEAHVIF
jgi:hypothetical protein